VQAFYSDHFVLPLPEGHRFPMAKYRLLRERVAAELAGIQLSEPDAASVGQLALAHAPDYIERVLDGRLEPHEVRAIGFPWSPPMVERSQRSAGATIGACRAARLSGVAVNLAAVHTTHIGPAEPDTACSTMRRSPRAYFRPMARPSDACCRWRSSTWMCTRAMARRRS